MPISEKQRQRRRAKLGSSDAPAILGVSPWGTPNKVYWSKQIETDDEPTAAMQTGNRLEGPLLDFAAGELGVSLVRNQYRVSPDNDGVLAANLDALVVGRPEAIEAKYVGPANERDWGTPGTDEIPDYVIVQVQHQMHVADLQRVWVAAAIARWQLEWVIFRVERNEPIIQTMVEAELNFWHNHVLPGIPPTDEPAPLEVLKAIHREPASTAELPIQAAMLWDGLQEIRGTIKASEATEKDIYARLVQALGEAEAGRLPDGRLLTYLSQRGAPRFDAGRLRLEHPGIYEQYATETTHRVLRCKAPKK